MSSYAQWKPNKCTIQYNGNGATSGAVGDQTITYDKWTQSISSNSYKKNGKTPVKSNLAWNNNELASPVPKPLAALNMVNMASYALQIFDRVYVYILLIIRVKKIVKIFSKHRKNLKKKNRKIQRLK